VETPKASVAGDGTDINKTAPPDAIPATETDLN